MAIANCKPKPRQREENPLKPISSALYPIFRRWYDSGFLTAERWAQLCRILDRKPSERAGHD